MVCNSSEAINLSQGSPKGFPFSENVPFHISNFIHFFAIQDFSQASTRNDLCSSLECWSYRLTLQRGLGSGMWVRFYKLEKLGIFCTNWWANYLSCEETVRRRDEILPDHLVLLWSSQEINSIFRTTIWISPEVFLPELSSIVLLTYIFTSKGGIGLSMDVP